MFSLSSRLDNIVASDSGIGVIGVPYNNSVSNTDANNSKEEEKEAVISTGQTPSTLRKSHSESIHDGKSIPRKTTFGRSSTTVLTPDPDLTFLSPIKTSEPIVPAIDDSSFLRFKLKALMRLSHKDSREITD